MIRAIFIDSKNKQISQVTIDPKDYRSPHKLIGCELIQVALRLENSDTLIVDEEGLINGTENFFGITGAPQPYAGNALIVGGTDSKGHPTDCESELGKIFRQVVFFPRSELDPDYLDRLMTPQFIPLSDSEMADYWKTGKIPAGKANLH